MPARDAGRSPVLPGATVAPRFHPGADADDGPLEVVVATTVPGPVGPDALGVLSPEERGRAGRLRRPEDVARFVTGRVVVRGLVGARLGVPPDRVELAVPRPGWKPWVPGTTVELSIAHAADAVLAVLTRRPVVVLDAETGGRIAAAPGR